MTQRIAIIGGGISGLSAAYALEEKRRAGALRRVRLVRVRARASAACSSPTASMAALVEAGPDSFHHREALGRRPLPQDRTRATNSIGSNDSERKTYILAKGKLVVMPDGLMFMVPTKIMPTVFSPLFSAAHKNAHGGRVVPSSRTRPRPTKPLPRWSNGTTVRRWSTCSRIRCSPESMAARLPQLSVRAVLPRFADMESKHGSLGRAMLSARRKMGAAAKAPPKPLFSSLKDGMQQMVDALVARLDADSLKVSVPVQSVIRQDDGWTVCAGYQTDHFDAVIIATPGQAASFVLEAADANLSHELREIKYSSSVTVTLGYDDNVRRTLPPGFGFLVPRSEGHRMLAATFVHNKFPHRAPDNRALVRCFLGGARDEQILQASEKAILEIVRAELQKIIGLNVDPLFARVYKWKAAMAQYSVGHLERLQRIETLRQKLQNVALAGNGYNGIGVPDCVRSGAEAAGKILAEMGMWSSA